MANMSYCRFQNTVLDLKDCERNLFDDVGHDEAFARERLIELCRKIVDQADDYDFTNSIESNEEQEEG